MQAKPAFIASPSALGNPSELEAKANDGRTPLHAAALTGHVDTARLFLEKGADIHARDEEGRTPLHRAALQGHREMVAFLLARGADRAARDKQGRTPLQLTDERGLRGLLRANAAGE